MLTWVPWVLCSVEVIQEPYKGFSNNIIYLNNITDPIVYAFLSKKFRDDLKNLIKNIWKRIRC